MKRGERGSTCRAGEEWGDVGADGGTVDGGRRLVGRADSEECRKVYVSGACACPGAGGGFRKRRRTTGVSSVDNGC